MIAPHVDVPEEARYEVKFASRIADLDRVQQWLRTHPAGFVTPYPDRRVNNVYFDTVDYAAVDDKLAGTSARTKVRYRWYGDQLLPQTGVLECKCRRNMFGWKRLYRAEQAPDTSSWPQLVRSLRTQLPVAGKVMLDEHPMAVMINRYDRQYFESSDGHVRATIDTNLQAYDQRFKPRPNVQHKAPLAPTLVLELKFARDARDLASEYMVDVPIRVSAHSKYTLAVESISAH